MFLATLAACSDDETARVQPLLDALARDAPDANAGLGGLGPDDTDAVAPICRMIEADNRRYVQLALIRVLQKIGDHDAVPALGGALKHHDAVVRAAAAAAHWSITKTHRPGLAHLIEAILGPRSGRATALKEFERAQDIPAAVVNDLAAGVRREIPEAADAIASLGPDGEAALPALRATLAQKSSLAMRAAAARALYRVGGDPKRALAILVGDLASVPPMARQRYHRAIMEMKQDRPNDVAAAVETMLLAASQPEKTRLLGVQILKECGIGGAILKRVAKEDPSPKVREAATR